MDHDFADRFARDWEADWNSRDLDRVLAHYADDVTFQSPLIARFTGDETGIVRGKEALRAYWAEGLRRLPNLHFEVVDVRASVDTLVLNYRNQDGGLVSEVLTLRDGLVVAGLGAYAR